MALVVPSVLIDSYLYGKPVLAFLNILLYNRSAASGAGSQVVLPTFNLALPDFYASPHFFALGHLNTTLLLNPHIPSHPLPRRLPPRK